MARHYRLASAATNEAEVKVTKTPMHGTNDVLFRVEQDSYRWIEVRVSPGGHQSVWDHALGFTQAEAVEWLRTLDLP